MNCFFTTILSALAFLNHKSIHSFTFHKSFSYRIRNHRIAIGDRKDCPVLFKEAHHLCKLVPTNADSSVDIVQERKVEVISVLRNVIDPEAGTDIIESGWISINADVNSVPEFYISSDGNVSLTLSLPSDYGSDIYEEIKKICILEISMLDWVDDVKITLKDSKPQSTILKPLIEENKSSTGDIRHIIAVSSCKGGVGKSTVTVNLAYTLSKQGYSVGILDADIYGPSLPTMTTSSNEGGGIRTMYNASTNKLMPVEMQGVKLLSLGFINKGAAIMRGPMVNQILNQFVSLCDWGSLDFLLIDMPPGTGDIQLTLAQIMNISAAVVVTTPQKLSFVDVVKGIDMFDTVNIPCVAVVENMAEYEKYSFGPDFYSDLRNSIVNAVKEDVESDSIDEIIRKKIESQRKPQRLFGAGHIQRLQEMWGYDETIGQLISLPLDEEMSSCGDKGSPYVLKYPASPIADKMRTLANCVVNELEKGRAAQSNKFGYEQERIYMDDNTLNTAPRRVSLSPFELRSDCRCALCVEELTGKRILDPSSIDATSIRPLSMASIGRYAMSVDWNDGHKSLYPFKQVTALFDKQQRK
eukprot:gene23447-31794_t